MFTTLNYNVDKEIATITLNRPEANNAFDLTLFSEVTQAVEQCSRDNSIRAVMITGNGKNFSSGGDIRAMASMDFITQDLATLTGKMSGAVRRCWKPVIAKINGSAAGAGCALALACDFRIMTKRSVFITAFINVALSGDTSAIYHLYHHVGLAKTIELMALSKPIYGEEALQLGLATMLVPEEELDEATDTFVQSFRNRPTGAFARQKQIIYETFYHDFEEYSQLESRLMVDSSKTEDHAEAVTAFLAKRKPTFKGI